MKFPSIAKARLAIIIEKTLAPYGFKMRSDGCLFACMNDEVVSVVGLRRSRTDAQECAVYFAVWLAEFEEPIPVLKEVSDCLNSIRNIGFSYELSPIAPLQNTFWWPLNDLSVELEEILVRQIHLIVLPYFETFKSPSDVIDALLFDQQPLGAEVDKKMRARVKTTGASDMTSAKFSMDAARAKVWEALEFLQEEPFLFRLSNGRFWRERDGVIDLVIPEFMASTRFVMLYCAVWHSSLNEGIDGDVPGGVTLVTSRQICEGGFDASDDAGLWFLGDSGLSLQQISGISTSVRKWAMNWFDNIVSRDDVINAIRPEYRNYLPIE